MAAGRCFGSDFVWRPLGKVNFGGGAALQCFGFGSESFGVNCQDSWTEVLRATVGKL